jgi:hypothetical protein
MSSANEGKPRIKACYAAISTPSLAKCGVPGEMLTAEGMMGVPWRGRLKLQDAQQHILKNKVSASSFRLTMNEVKLAARRINGC